MLKTLRFTLLFCVSLSAYGAQKHPYYVEAQFGYGVIPIFGEKDPIISNFGAGINLGYRVDDTSTVELNILKDRIKEASASKNSNQSDIHIIHFNLLYKRTWSSSDEGRFQIYSKLGAGPALYYNEISNNDASSSSATKVILPTVLAELGVRYNISPHITTGLSAALVGIKIFAFGTIAYHWD